VTRIYVDCEFIDTGRDIDLISIGMVREDGEELYLVAQDTALMERASADDWLREHVIPSLPGKCKENLGVPMYDLHPTPGARMRLGGPYVWEWDEKHPDAKSVMGRYQMKRQVRSFVLMTKKPQLWAWYGAYDHVVIAQLFGRMHDLPEGFPMVTLDLKQEHLRLGSPKLPRQAEGEHNALADARHNARIAQWLKEYEETNYGLRRRAEGDEGW
jgi:hypothetical protein